MRKCLLVLNVVAALLLAPTLLAQAPRPQTPPRDITATAKPGTAAITGVVIAADTRKPLRRARISVSAPELGGPPRTTNTDRDGRYEIGDLPAGRYRVSVTRSGYLPLQYGQRRALEQGQPLDVVEGQIAKDVDFVMPRMGVITGRVTDEVGEPVEGVSVLALRLRYWEGRRQLVPTVGGMFRSDDAGQYRILGLAPGTYYVQATTRETWTETEAGVSRTMGYAPTYFPGTVQSTVAARVNIGLGQEVSSVDISLVPGRAATISGTAFDSAGRPFSNVALRAEVRGEDFSGFSGAGSAAITGNGTFTLRNVPPGEYKLVASSGRDTERPEVAILPITVDGVDITDVALTGSEGGIVTGRVLTDTGEVPTIRGLRINLAAPQAGQVDPTLLGLFRNPGSSEVASDGTFSIKGVFGASRLRVTLTDDWAVKAIFHEGREITDSLIELRSGQAMSAVDVVVTNRVSIVSGQLSDAKGVSVTDGTMIVFPEDAALWGEDSRRIRTARPDRGARYQIKGLPAGEYLAIALEYVENGLWYDPEFLESLRRHAQRVTVTDGGTHELALRLLAPEVLK
jgi:hypothetical protein